MAFHAISFSATSVIENRSGGLLFRSGCALGVHAWKIHRVCLTEGYGCREKETLDLLGKLCPSDCVCLS